MNKDFWKRVNRLDELTRKATQGEWSSDATGYVFRNSNASSEREKMPIVLLCGSLEQYNKSRFDSDFIAAANPAMILEMIEYIFAEQERCKRTEESNIELRNKLINSEKEANWLAEKLVNHGILQNHGKAILAVGQDEKVKEAVNKAYHINLWREAARKAVEKDK